MEIKRFKDFLENAAASASSSAGMGAVSSEYQSVLITFTCAFIMAI